MIVLAINDGHEAGACLLRDGRILECSVEERRLNVKNVPGVPKLSIPALLSRAGISASQVDLITLTSRIRTIQPDHRPRPALRALQVLWKVAKTEWGTNLGRKI